MKSNEAGVDDKTLMKQYRSTIAVRFLLFLCLSFTYVVCFFIAPKSVPPMHPLSKFSQLVLTSHIIIFSCIIQQDLKAKLEAASKGIISADPDTALGQALQ